MWNNKKRSRASQTWCGVGAEVCSVNKRRPLMYERAAFSRWENDTHCISHCITVCNILCLCRNIVRMALQTQASQICSEGLASVAVTSLFIHFFSLHTQRLDFYDVFNRLIRNRLICLNLSSLSVRLSSSAAEQRFIHACEDYLGSCLYCVADWLTGPLAFR